MGRLPLKSLWPASLLFRQLGQARSAFTQAFRLYASLVLVLACGPFLGCGGKTTYTIGSDTCPVKEGPSMVGTIAPTGTAGFAPSDKWYVAAADTVTPAVTSMSIGCTDSQDPNHSAQCTITPTNRACTAGDGQPIEEIHGVCLAVRVLECANGMANCASPVLSVFGPTSPFPDLASVPRTLSDPTFQVVPVATPEATSGCLPNGYVGPVSATVQTIVVSAMSGTEFAPTLNYNLLGGDDHWVFQEALDPAGKLAENFSPAVRVTKVQISKADGVAMQFCGVTIGNDTCGVGPSGDTVNLDACSSINGSRPVTPAWKATGTAPTVGNGVTWKVQFKLGSCSQTEPPQGTDLRIHFTLQ